MKPGLRLFLVWLMLLPAVALWVITARSRGLGSPWVTEVPLGLVTLILAAVINHAPPWGAKMQYRHVATLGYAVLLTTALLLTLGIAEFAVARFLR
jgi:hypothetical protein